MKLIVGLGNPGLLYKNTRHNIGFYVIDEILKDMKITKFKTKFGGLYNSLLIKDQQVIFLKPYKYINLSGEVIKDFVDYFNINISDILIIHDDLDLPIGYYKIKKSGGTGGHNGLKSVEGSLKTKNYTRLKIGISNNKSMETHKYVLEKFSLKEREELEKNIIIIKKMVFDYINMDLKDVMNKYNKKYLKWFSCQEG
ncbi:MAG: aminoacyl-tRNA hydrolase [Bacilli bacterium]